MGLLAEFLNGTPGRFESRYFPGQTSAATLWYASTMPKKSSATTAVVAETPIETPVSIEPAPSEAEPIQTPAPTEPAPQPASTVEDVLRLKHDYESKREAAIAELLKKRTDLEKAFNENLSEIERHLEELGHDKEPAWVPVAPVPASAVTPFRKAKTKTKAKSKSATEKFCPICTTDPENPVFGHDGRRHKSQGKRKRPFTAAQLAALG